MKKELKRFAAAFNGLYLLFTREPHGRVHLVAMVLAIAAGWYFRISALEWMAILIAIGIVIGAEGLNTAIEKLGDFVHKEKHNEMRHIKDIAAGAVLIAAIVAAVVACIIFIPKIL
jgi:diacylglycerol kinase